MADLATSIKVTIDFMTDSVREAKASTDSYFRDLEARVEKASEALRESRIRMLTVPAGKGSASDAEAVAEQKRLREVIGLGKEKLAAVGKRLKQEIDLEKDAEKQKEKLAREAQERAERTASRIKLAILGIAVAPLALRAAFNGAVGFFEEAYERVEQLGTAAENWQVSGEKAAGVFVLAGNKSAEVAAGVDRLSLRMMQLRNGSESARVVFERYGIDVKKLTGGDAVDGLAQIADAFQRITDKQERGRLAVAAFGDSAEAMLAKLSNGGKAVREATRQADNSLLGVSPRDLELARQGKRAIEDIGNAFEGIKQQVAVGLAPLLKAVSESLQFGPDQKGAAKSIIDVMVDGIEGVVSIVAGMIKGLTETVITAKDFTLGLKNASESMKPWIMALFRISDKKGYYEALRAQRGQEEKRSDQAYKIAAVLKADHQTFGAQSLQNFGGDKAQGQVFKDLATRIADSGDGKFGDFQKQPKEKQAQQIAKDLADLTAAFESIGLSAEESAKKARQAQDEIRERTKITFTARPGEPLKIVGNLDAALKAKLEAILPGLGQSALDQAGESLDGFMGNLKKRAGQIREEAKAKADKAAAEAAAAGAKRKEEAGALALLKLGQEADAMETSLRDAAAAIGLTAEQSQVLALRMKGLSREQARGIEDASNLKNFKEFGFELDMAMDSVGKTTDQIRLMRLEMAGLEVAQIQALKTKIAQKDALTMNDAADGAGRLRRELGRLKETADLANVDPAALGNKLNEILESAAGEIGGYTTQNKAGAAVMGSKEAASTLYNFSFNDRRFSNDPQARIESILRALETRARLQAEYGKRGAEALEKLKVLKA